MSASRPAIPSTALCAATDHDRRHPVRRFRKPFEARRVDVCPVELDEPVAEELADQGDRLLEAIEAHPRPIPLDAHRLVLPLEPSGPEAQFEASAGEEVERRELLGEHHRLAVVDTEHAGTDADRFGGFDRDRHRRNGGDVLHRVVGRGEGGSGADHMVGNTERREPEVLGSLGLVPPVLRTRGGIALNSEPERATHRPCSEPCVTCICDPQS